MNKKIIRYFNNVISTSLFFLLTFTILHVETVKADDSRNESRWWIISDNHYLAPELYDEGEAFIKIEASISEREVRYQTEALKGLVDSALKQQPEGIIITGDLTLNGEKVSAEALKTIFLPLKEKGIQVFVIPGNHDINNGWAREFKGKEQLQTSVIMPEDFTHLFPDGYSYEARDDASLSYAVSWDNNYRFLFLDTNIYNHVKDNLPPKTNGILRKNSLIWIQKQLEEAKIANQQTIIFMHHNLYRHSEMRFQGYVLDNSFELIDLIKNYQVPLVFSGHMHIQDIIQPDKKLPPEIMTGSYSILDLNYGELTLTEDSITYKKKTIDLDSWAKEMKSGDKNLIHYQSYQEEKFITNSEGILTSGVEEKKEEQALLLSSAKLLAELNVKTFSGNDYYQTEDLIEIKNSKEYAYIQENTSFIKNYLEFLISDTSPDTELMIQIGD